MASPEVLPPTRTVEPTRTSQGTASRPTILVLHPDLFGGPVHVPYLMTLVRNLPQYGFLVLTGAPSNMLPGGALPPEATFAWRGSPWLERAERALPAPLARPFGVAADVLKALQYRRLVRRSSFDLVHVHVGLELENLQRAGRKLRLRGLWTIARWLSDLSWCERPVVFTDHSLFTRRDEFGYPNPLHEADMAVTDAYGNVICVERDGYEYLGRRDSLRRIVRRRWYVPNGIDTKRFAFRPLVRHDRLRLGYAGRLFRAGESRDFLPRVAAALPPGIELHLAVASPIREDEIRRRWFPQPNVVIRRNVPNEQMPDFYGSIDLFVNPMLWSALGRTTLEAMSCGRAVAMFDNADRYPVTRETGYLISAHDPEGFVSLAVRLAGAWAELEVLGKNARAAVEGEFDERRVAAGTSAIYASLMGKSGRETPAALTQGLLPVVAVDSSGGDARP